MKILVTDSQYNRVLLKEGFGRERVYYKDDKITIFNYYTKEQFKYPIILEYDNEQFAEQNKLEGSMMGGLGFFVRPSDLTSPWLLSIAKTSPFIKLKDGNSFSVKPAFAQWVSFTVDKSKFGVFTASFTISVKFPNSPIINKTINIPFERIQGNDNLTFCKRVVNNDLLLKAKNWWKNWLGHQSTKDRFAKTFKYDKSTVDKHFAEYSKIIDQIKMNYVFSDEENPAWVSISSSAYNNPIIINCTVASKDSPEFLERLLIHEIQHILEDHHKFYTYEGHVPIEGGLFDDKKGIFHNSNIPDESLQWGVTKPVGGGKLKNYLISQGFKNNLDEIVGDYIYLLENSRVHLKNSTEILSVLAQVRRALNLRPDQKITKEMLINNTDDGEVRVFICQWLYSKKSLSDFLNFNNSIAMKKPDTTDKNLA